MPERDDIDGLPLPKCWPSLAKKAIAAVLSMPKTAFLGPLGGRLTESHTLKCLKEDREKLEIAQGVLHSFRHFFVSMCAQNGVAIFTCMSWVGHKDSDMVWHYYHLHDKASKDAMEGLAASRGLTPDGEVMARYQDRRNRRLPLGKKVAKSGS